MAKTARATVFTALYNLLLTASYPFTIQNKDGQDFRTWEQVISANQPALYLKQGPQKSDQDSGFGLNRWYYTATAWFFFRRDGSKPPAQVIDDVLDAVENIITPRTGVKQTLGNLVTNVRITEANFDEGELDHKGGQVVLAITLEILTSN